MSLEIDILTKEIQTLEDKMNTIIELFEISNIRKKLTTEFITIGLKFNRKAIPVKDIIGFNNDISIVGLSCQYLVDNNFQHPNSIMITMNDYVDIVTLRPELKIKENNLW